ncbi:hypothetical protein AB1Y20_009486 [Prymnesium parvum]|uniref:Uncharacterized protein n=1 Tax=Prymnesium parvum TaxID=97485 RepID=A0AB34K4Q5_PRYPA
MVAWLFSLQHGRWGSFDEAAVAALEAARSSGSGTCSISTRAGELSISLHDMTQTNLQTGTVRQVRRVDDAAALPPASAPPPPPAATAAGAAGAPPSDPGRKTPAKRSREGDKAPAASPPGGGAAAAPLAGPAAGGALSGLTICVTGQMSTVRRTFHAMMQAHGARIALSCTGAVTHVVTTACEADNPTRKVLQAIAKGTKVVTEQFIHDSIAAGHAVDPAPYFLIDPSAPPPGAGPVVMGNTVAAGAALRGVIAAARGAGPIVHVNGNAASAAAASGVMLANKYSEALDPTGWWISEKLDGVRAYWDGENFYSRNGNVFPAPDWFKQGLPSTPLDGELWAGRGQFRRCLGIVRNRGSGALWQYVTYLVFDAPSLAEPYESRVAYIMKTVVPIDKPDQSSDPSTAQPTTSGCPYAAPVGICQCTGRAHLKSELEQVQAKRGEGLMLRRPGSPYEHARSNHLLKVKSFHDEEAKVVGHEGGTGRNAYRLGALTLVTPDGRQFSCGSGLTDKDRSNPPPIGTVVTYRFPELMDNGYPRFPVFVATRTDLDWTTICANYVAPNAANVTPAQLKRQHSILYQPPALQRSLSERAIRGVTAGSSSTHSAPVDDTDDEVLTDEEDVATSASAHEAESEGAKLFARLAAASKTGARKSDYYNSATNEWDVPGLESDLRILLHQSSNAESAPSTAPLEWGKNVATWRHVVHQRGFEYLKVTFGLRDYPLRPEQSEELVRWLSGRWNEGWLKVVDGLPSHFLMRDGRQAKLLMDVASARAAFSQ